MRRWFIDCAKECCFHVPGSGYYLCCGARLPRGIAFAQTVPESILGNFQPNLAYAQVVCSGDIKGYIRILRAIYRVHIKTGGSNGKIKQEMETGVA